MIDRFALWLIFWSLYGLVLVQDESQLEKMVLEMGRGDDFASEELSKSIIYPNSGLEVQLINGLRTQSSLNIP